MDKNSLLASLTGDLPGVDGADRSGSPDQDLFGDIALDDPPPLAATPDVVGPPQAPAVQPAQQNGPIANGTAHVPDEIAKEVVPPLPTAPTLLPEPIAAAAPPKPADSLLSKSGLLMGGDDGGGGLFDEVDQEEREKEEREAAEKRRLEEEQRKREEEERRLKEEEEKRRREALEAEQRRREEEQLRLQQQQQLQQQQLQQQQLQQQQQQMQYQQQYQQQYHQQQPMPSYQQQSATMQPQAANLMQQQQLDSQFQSISLNGPTQQNQFQQPLQQHNMAVSQPDMGGFYRDHAPAGNPMMAASSTLPIASAPGTPSNSYGGVAASSNAVPSASGTYYYGTQQPMPSSQPPLPIPRSPARPVPPGPGSTTAGMHNASPNRLGIGSMGQVRKITLTKPQETAPMFTKIAVTDPMLIQNPNFLLMASPPYWSYQVTSNLAIGGGVWLVRRRFRHVVALEERMRQACPGCILPPRPDKHATRALEEASTQQSAEFAMHRAKEMEAYLTALAQHPIAGHSHVLKLFLGLQDDIGTAWAEVSPNALTRLGAVGAGVSMKVAESTSSALPSWAGGDSSLISSSPAQDLEDNAEIIALHSSEHLRMGAVTQAVPKLEGAVALWREVGDLAGATGMELSKLAKQPDQSDIGKPAELLSNGILRHGRRTKRLALELSAALEPFMIQYKLCKYEKLAFQDRRNALLRRSKERGRADSRATMLVHQQRQLHASGQFGRLDQLERNAATSDEMALDAVHDAEEVGATLRQEINRVAYKRRTEWHASMKVIASAFKEASSERLAIWESTREAFEAAFPEYSTTNSATANGTY